MIQDDDPASTGTIAAANRLLASLCACSTSDPAPEYELEIELEHSNRTYAHHLFAGGLEARACFFDTLARELPPRIFRTRGRARVRVPALEPHPNDPETLDRILRTQLLSVDLSRCSAASQARARSGCTTELEVRIEAASGTLLTGLFAASDSEGIECLARSAARYDPPRDVVVEWSVTPRGPSC